MKRFAAILTFAFVLSFTVVLGQSIVRPRVALADNNYQGCASNTGCAPAKFVPPAPWPGCHWNSTNLNYASGRSANLYTTPPAGDGRSGVYMADVLAVQDSDSNGHPCHDTYVRVSIWESFQGSGGHVPSTLYDEIRVWTPWPCSGQIGEWWANRDTPQGDWMAIYTNLLQTGWCAIAADSYGTNAQSPSICVSGSTSCNPAIYPPATPAYPYANF